VIERMAVSWKDVLCGLFAALAWVCASLANCPRASVESASQAGVEIIAAVPLPGPIVVSIEDDDRERKFTNPIAELIDCRGCCEVPEAPEPQRTGVKQGVALTIGYGWDNQMMSSAAHLITPRFNAQFPEPLKARIRTREEQRHGRPFQLLNLLLGGAEGSKCVGPLSLTSRALQAVDRLKQSEALAKLRNFFLRVTKVTRQVSAVAYSAARDGGQL